MAVAGIYPIFFPKPGYKGQLAWLQDTAACGGEDAYSILLSAATEGEVQLPRHVEIRHSIGLSVHLGPGLTTPSPGHLKRTPSLSLEVREGVLVTKHRELERQERREEAWELQVPEPPEVEEIEDGKKEEKGKEEVKEKEEKEKKEKKEEDHGCEEEEVEFEVEKPSEKTREEVRRQREEELARRKKIFVQSDDPSVTLDDLRAHFEQHDIVENIYLYRDHAVVTLKSAVVSQSLAGKVHTLQRTPEQGGCVPLRLRGGSGRVRGVPPNQQRDNTCPFRYPGRNVLYNAHT